MQKTKITIAGLETTGYKATLENGAKVVVHRPIKFEMDGFYDFSWSVSSPAGIEIAQTGVNSKREDAIREANSQCRRFKITKREIELSHLVPQGVNEWRDGKISWGQGVYWDVFAYDGDQSRLQVQRIDEPDEIEPLESDEIAHILARRAGFDIDEDGFLNQTPCK